MIASVHAVDTGAARAVATTFRRAPSGRVEGLRWGSTALLKPLASGNKPSLQRVALIAFWSDEAAVDTFLTEHPLGRRFVGGFEARLRPLRAYGTWPGFPEDVSTRRRVAHDGPVVVLTMSQLRASQLGRFLRTSRPAEEAAVADPNLLWGTAAARPPFAATISIWRDTDAVMSYAFDRQRPAHTDAIAEDRRRTFNRGALFARFAPIRMTGTLGGTNPLQLTDLAGPVDA